jgi:hypothetical protein
MNLNGVFLSDDLKNASGWAFPDTNIYPHSFLIVYDNNSAATEGLICDFSLSSTGGQLLMAYDNEHRIDMVSYNQNESVRTIGRYPNGVGDFIYMIPTLSKNNYPGFDLSNIDFTVYPNPAQNSVYVEVNNIASSMTIEIYSINGQLMYVNNFNNDDNEIPVLSKNIDITSFSKGVYLAKLVTVEKTITKKIIKL